ncbi:hypothetical protein AB0J86_15605 [Micromonospora sp. NPDC049559]|uniref:hypothetical protein n=1 Tax=Micromonospora sp. NPDC049559 TaxID=3155923 RepID=UPI00343822E3
MSSNGTMSSNSAMPSNRAGGDGRGTRTGGRHAKPKPPRRLRSGRLARVVPIVAVVVLLPLVSVTWLAGRPGEAGSGSRPVPDDEPAAEAPAVPESAGTDATVAASATPVAAPGGPAGAPVPGPNPGAVQPGGQPGGQPGAQPGRATATRAAPATTKPPAAPAPQLRLTPRVDCPDWGVHLQGSVANAGGRAIDRVQVYHGAVGSTPADTFWLSPGGGSGSFTDSAIETWVPNYSGDPFRDGDRVSWRVTAYLAGGATVSAEGTSYRGSC